MTDQEALDAIARLRKSVQELRDAAYALYMGPPKDSAFGSIRSYADQADGKLAAAASAFRQDRELDARRTKRGA